MVSIQTCEPCNKNAWEVYDIRSSRIKGWLSLANKWGKEYSVNPGLLLAVISIESNGKIDSTPYYGLTQIGEDMLNAYNSDTNNNYELTDLRAEGPNINSEEEAASLGIKIFAQFISVAMFLLDSTSDIYGNDRIIKDATTRWNGSICKNPIEDERELISFYPFGEDKTKFTLRNYYSCYGFNVYRLMDIASDWCGTSPWYKSDLTDDATPDSTYVMLLGN